MSRITAAIWITSISTSKHGHVARVADWRLHLPSLWRAASIRRIGAGRVDGPLGDWSKPLKGLPLRMIKETLLESLNVKSAIVRLRFANRTYGL